MSSNARFVDMESGNERDLTFRAEVIALQGLCGKKILRYGYERKTVQ